MTSHPEQAEAPAQTVRDHQGRTGTTATSPAETISITDGKGTVELRTDGVVHVIWKPQGTIDAADALAALAAVNEVCRGSSTPCWSIWQ